MRAETFFVKYISVHNCFLHFSERWLEKFKDTNNLSHVLKLEYGLKKCGYLSCSPESYTSTSNSNNDVVNNNNNIVGISATYAQKLGLKDKEKVTISVCSNVCSVSRISVSAVTADDWEILEMNSNLVQSSLLDQVRVVWCNQILVVWVSRSMYLSLRVDGFESDCIAGVLEPLSDVVVTPPGASTLVNESSVEHTSLKRDLLKQTSQNCDGQIEDFSPGQSLMSMLWDTLRSYVSDRGSKKQDALMKDPLRTEAKRQTITVLQKCNHRPLPAVYRVHPLSLPSSENERKSGDYLLLHPYNVFIRRCCMPSVDAVFFYRNKGVLTCKLMRIPDPTDSKDSHSKRGSKYGELHRQENATVRTAKASSVSIHVQLYVIEDIYDSLSDSFKEYVDEVTVNKRIGHDSLLVSAAARLVLDVRIGARVNLEVVTCAAGCLVSEIQITPLGNLEMSAKELEALFRCYVAKQVGTHGLLINSESFLSLQATACTTAHVYVSLLPSDMEYAILDPDSVRKCKFTVKENTSHLVCPSFNKELPTSDICNVHFGGYFKKLLSEGLTTLELSLHLTPLVARPLSLRANFISDNILILGTAGSGKSTLARTICRELEKPPHFVHCVEIQCKPLKGKKVETLQKHISQFLRECVYYQPAVLMFDDLESIAGIGGSASGQPASEDSYYYTRVGERLSELLEEFQSSNSISVVVTAPSLLKVNSALVAPRGRHIFKTVLEIPELNKDDRLDILKSVVSQRSDVTTDSVIPLNWSKIAGRSEGYVMQDLVDLADKAIFQACKKAVSAQKHNEALSLELDNSDFEEALNNSVPLLQRGMEFYNGSSHSWDDIGGLSDVKKILTEVLQWPSKYPEIFENAPLRVQSGLLLYGAPGTGKTLLAGAVAKECGLKFISIKGPELLSKYIGASEEAVRNVFQKAQSAKPCVLFFDEFDSLAPRRGHDSTGVTDRVVNQLLTQLDGVESLRGVSVVAATSRPDLIDPALLRPGRLDRIIKCPLPDRDDRLAILRALSRKLVLSEDINFGEIADETEGFTGADLQAVLYTALLLAVERNVALCGDVDDKDVKQDPVTGDLRAKSEKVISGPVVTQANLKAALKDTKPSLSDKEKLRYRLIYGKFERSRGGSSVEEIAAMPQRATLA